MYIRLRDCGLQGRTVNRGYTRIPAFGIGRELAIIYIQFGQKYLQIHLAATLNKLAQRWAIRLRTAAT